MIKLTKKIFILALCGIMAGSLMLGGCSQESYPVTKAPTAPEGETAAGSSSALTVSSADIADLIDVVSTTKKDAVVYEDTEHEYGYQLEMPQKGEQIAIIHTDEGDIYMRFFPEAAPKAVENFLTHAKNGYYDGLKFHRVINEFMVQGGDPEGTGSGGESVWGGAFEDEFSDHLFNLRGAVAMANSGKDTNKSQFFINHASAETFAATPWSEREDYWKNTVFPLLSDAYTNGTYESFLAGPYASNLTDTDLVPEEVQALYAENGGNIHLDGAFNAADKGHTVFAQVFKGMDVVDKLAAVEVDADSYVPVADILINSVEVTTYEG